MLVTDTQFVAPNFKLAVETLRGDTADLDELARRVAASAAAELARRLPAAAAP